MSNDHPAQVGAGRAGGGVRTLDPRLDAMLVRRGELVNRWAEAVAHGYMHSVDLLDQLIEVESLIAYGWPRIWLQHSRGWFERDAALVHSASNPSPACPTCRARAAALGAPEAA